MSPDQRARALRLAEGLELHWGRAITMHNKEAANLLRELAAEPVRQWLGPYTDAWTALNELRRAVAEVIGADPDVWPTHGNAPLAIAASVATRQMELKKRDAASAEPVRVPLTDANFNHAQGGQNDGQPAPQDQRVQGTLAGGDRPDEQDQVSRAYAARTGGCTAREPGTGSAMGEHRRDALAAGADGLDAGRGAADVLLKAEEIKRLWCGCKSIQTPEFAVEFARAVERAHGITGDAK